LPVAGIREPRCTRKITAPERRYSRIGKVERPMAAIGEEKGPRREEISVYGGEA